MGECITVCKICGHGIHIGGLGVHACASPTRTRIHVGWRVVRMRDGVREWSSGNGRWTRMPSLAITLSPRHQWLANDLAGEYGGRVVRVSVSYRKRGSHG